MQSGDAGFTRKGWAMLAIAGAMAASAVLFGVQELYAVAIAAVVLVVGARVWVGGQHWDLRVTRHIHPARVPAGVEARVELSVRNYGGRRSPVVSASDPFDGGKRWARFSIAPLIPGETRVASYRLPTSQRGVFTLGPLELELTDPFGLSRATRTATPDASLTVHPRIERVTSRSVTAHNDRDTRIPMPVLGRGGDEFYGLREYEPGDDLRMVHWPSSARIDNLAIRQAENLWRGQATIGVDLRAAVHDHDTIEPVLSAAASLAMSSLRAGLHVRVVTTGGFDSGFGTTNSHGAGILDVLAGVVTHPGSALADGLRSIKTGEPLTIVTTDATSEAEVAAAARVSGMSRTTVVVFERAQKVRPAGYRAPRNSRLVRVPRGSSFRAMWESSVSC